MVVLAVSSAFLADYILSESAEHDDGQVPELPVHQVSPLTSTYMPENVTNVTAPNVTIDFGPPPGYLLYDDFSRENGKIWTVSSYTPSSTFIDTTFVPAGVSFDSGDLVLKSYVDRHLGAEYKTKRTFLFGRYRASMKVDQTPGTYLTFFVYTPEPGNHNEIDIELVKSGNATKAILTTWYHMVKNEHTYWLSFDPSADYHLYGFDWYPDRVDFFIDNTTVPLWTSTADIPQGACYLYLNSWVVRNVPQSHGDGNNTQYVDWVTVQPLNDTT